MGLRVTGERRGEYGHRGTPRQSTAAVFCGPSPLSERDKNTLSPAQGQRRRGPGLPDDLDQQHPGIGDARDKGKDESPHEPVEPGGHAEQVDRSHEKRNAGKLGLHNPDYQPQTGRPEPDKT